VIASLLLAAATLFAGGLEPLRRELGPDAAFTERHTLVDQQGRIVSRVEETAGGDETAPSSKATLP